MSVRYDVIEIVEVERRGIIDRDYVTYRENLSGAQAERAVENLGPSAWTFQVAERYFDTVYGVWSTTNPIPADEWLQERYMLRDEE